jgi:hypothetical protein
MKIENKTQKTLILNMGFDDEPEPDFTVELKPGEETDLKPAWDRIVINEG